MRGVLCKELDIAGDGLNSLRPAPVQTPTTLQQIDTLLTKSIEEAPQQHSQVGLWLLLPGSGILLPLVPKVHVCALRRCCVRCGRGLRHGGQRASCQLLQESERLLQVCGAGWWRAPAAAALLRTLRLLRLLC